MKLDASLFQDIYFIYQMDETLDAAGLSLGSDKEEAHSNVLRDFIRLSAESRVDEIPSLQIIIDCMDGLAPCSDVVGLRLVNNKECNIIELLCRAAKLLSLRNKCPEYAEAFEAATNNIVARTAFAAKNPIEFLVMQQKMLMENAEG